MQASDTSPSPNPVVSPAASAVPPVSSAGASTPAPPIPSVLRQNDISFGEIAGTLSGHHPLKQWIAGLPPLPQGQTTASLLVALAQAAQKLATSYNEATPASIPDLTGYEVTSYFPYTRDGEQFVNTFVIVRTKRNLADGSVIPLTSEDI